MNVQIRLAEEVSADQTNSIVTVTCPACTGLHFINKSTRKLAGDRENILTLAKLI
jgi:RNase P subunit RPR2